MSLPLVFRQYAFSFLLRWPEHQQNVMALCTLARVFAFVTQFVRLGLLFTRILYLFPNLMLD